MKCKGNFVFKNLTHRQGGTFKDSNGNEINYPSAYILKVDELKDNGDADERKFKVSENQVTLINDLETLEQYQKIELEFDLTLYSNKMALVVSDVSIN